VDDLAPCSREQRLQAPLLLQLKERKAVSEKRNRQLCLMFSRSDGPLPMDLRDESFGSIGGHLLEHLWEDVWESPVQFIEELTLGPALMKKSKPFAVFRPIRLTFSLQKIRSPFQRIFSLFGT
jgi:hypothetical protein